MSDPVQRVREAVSELEAALPGLIERCDDPDGIGLGELLYDVRAARETLQGLERDVEGATAKAMMSDQVMVDGPTGIRIERRRGKDRREWDHDLWQRDAREKVLRKHGALRATGLVTADGEVVEVNPHDLLRDVESVHSTTAPKVTALRNLGLSADDYCHSSPGRVSVTVTKTTGGDDG